LLIGVGALGSAIAELLVRMGVKDIILLDGETLEVGNLCRHTGYISDIGKSKAESLAATLNRSGPYVECKFINNNFYDCNDTEKAQIRERNVILDCTANDELLHEMSLFEWNDDKIFISLSFGMFAKRLFYFAFHGRKFPKEIFTKYILPWIAKEREENKGIDLPQEGVGCWHPLFPAKLSDIWLMSSISVKLFEYDWLHQPCKGVFRVFEQNIEENTSVTVKKIQEKKC